MVRPGGGISIFAPESQRPQWIVAGEKMIVRGTAADPEFRVVSAVPAGAFGIPAQVFSGIAHRRAAQGFAGAKAPEPLDEGAR